MANKSQIYFQYKCKPIRYYKWGLFSGQTHILKYARTKLGLENSSTIFSHRAMSALLGFGKR